MAKVFVDVGAHTGETLAVAMEPRWGFDRIWSFEPAEACWPVLREMADARVEVLPFGLWNRDATLTLHDPGAIGASIVEDKGITGDSQEIEVRAAGAWFAAHLDPADELVVKINCEGAECDVLDDLLDAGQLAHVDELLVHFDVRKIPSEAHREDEVRRRLDAAGVRYRVAETIFYGRNVHEKTANWLAWYHAGPVGRVRYSLGSRLVYAVRLRGSRLKGRFRG